MIQALRVVFPVTIISMFLVTKWWYALPVDGPDKMYWGFPFVFMGEGFHTSMSYQFFMLEFLADFTIYFFFWMILIYFFYRLLPNIRVHRNISKILWSLTLIFIFGFGIIVGTSNSIFKTKRDYDYTVMVTGYVFIWQSTPQPDIYQYHPFKKEKQPENKSTH